MTETVQAFLRSREQDPGIAIKAGDRTWTWTEYLGEAGTRANAVRELLSPQRPAHVGLLFDNTVEMAFALASGALAGYVSVGLNLTRRGSGLRADILRADCQVVLTDHRYRPLLAGLDLNGVHVIDTDEPDWAARLEQHRGPVAAAREVAELDPFMLIFTSGTSGAPKAVPVTNFMVMLSGGNLVDRFGLGPKDTCYLSMPLFHSNAVLAGYAVAIRSGAAMALAERFSASAFLTDVRRYGATYMNYVGKPLAYILRTPSRPDDADNPLRVAFGNEASDRDIAAFSQRFGVTVRDGFGSTETAVIITREPGTPPGSIGLPWDGVTVYDRLTRTECPRARFDATGKVTNLEQAVGELVNVTGAGFFQGYYNDPEATEQRMDGGIYWSGDLAYRDDAGYIYLAGRTSDWLRVDGENLAAGIIEQILHRHPAVNQVAVYGIPDPLAGDQLVAALVLNDDPGLDPAAFGQFLAAQEDLSAKGWPRYVRLARDLPSTATNKVLKRELIQQGLDFTDPVWVRAERGRLYHAPGPT